MTCNSKNVIRFVPPPLEIITLAQLVEHGRYANPRYSSFWLGGEEEWSGDGEGYDISWSVEPLPGNKWEVIKVTRTFRPGEEPEDTIEKSGPLTLDALRFYLAETDHPISNELFDVLKTRAD